jgi:hypothetical protein
VLNSFNPGRFPYQRWTSTRLCPPLEPSRRPSPLHYNGSPLTLPWAEYRPNPTNFRRHDPRHSPPRRLSPTSPPGCRYSVNTARHRPKNGRFRYLAGRIHKCFRLFPDTPRLDRGKIPPSWRSLRTLHGVQSAPRTTDETRFARRKMRGFPVTQRRPEAHLPGLRRPRPEAPTGRSTQIRRRRYRRNANCDLMRLGRGHRRPTQ